MREIQFAWVIVLNFNLITSFRDLETIKTSPSFSKKQMSKSNYQKVLK